MKQCATCRLAALCLGISRAFVIDLLDHCACCKRVWICPSYDRHFAETQALEHGQLFYIPALPPCVDMEKDDLWPIDKCRECKKRERREEAATR